MKSKLEVEQINCPCCDASEGTPWVSENGFNAVKCSSCGLIYVNPRPIKELITEAVQTGVHQNVTHDRTAIGKRISSKVARYQLIFQDIFSDVWHQNKDISWLDVGAGYGEVVEAISMLATKGSNVMGIEPMKPKVTDAQTRGLKVRKAYLSEVNEQYDFVSLIDVFSHIPDFRGFLNDLKKVLKINGTLFIETGDVGKLTHFRQVPSEWDLPDHLVFASEQNMVDYLESTGFDIVKIEKRRVDGFITFVKNIAKKILGRQVNLSLPYTSPYRTMFIRAKYVKK
jgi:SAM-dependent methyltransferase